MSAETTEVNVTEDIRNIVTDVIAKNNLDPNSTITYNVGSETGDGYMSKCVSVEISSDGGRTDLFLKCPISTNDKSAEFLNVLYDNEVYFYDTIYPSYLKFAEDRGFLDNPKIAPKYYGKSPTNIIALENLKVKDFELFDRKKIMNESHILALLNSFAKYHAVLFAMQDQDKEEYKRLTDGIKPSMDFKNSPPNVDAMYKVPINNFLSKLDPEEDKNVLDKCDNLADRVWNYLVSHMGVVDQYSTITKGDCWSNNIMFRYEDENKQDPAEVVLVDWQLITIGSLVLDISYVFYTMACKKELDRFDFYLKSYHEDLRRYIKELGSDPEILYPYSVLEREWKTHCVYGYALAFLIFKFMLFSKDEAPNMAEVDFENLDVNKMLKLKNETEYVKRIKELTLHIIERNFLPGA